jgi:hypothetical protein
MKCSSCQKFQSLRKHNNSINGSYWKCNGKEIFADTEACKDFVLHHVLICPKKNKFRRMHVDACMHYMKEGCKCRVGSEIRSYIRSQPGKINRRKLCNSVTVS